MATGRSRSYSRGLSAMAEIPIDRGHSADNPSAAGAAPPRAPSSENTEEIEPPKEEAVPTVPFQRLSRVVRSIDSMTPIPPTAPSLPVGLSQYRIKMNKQRAPILQETAGADDSRWRGSPEPFNGGFFDNVAVRSHSYTSLSRLERLSELNRVATPKL